ncbi:hypothetical protein ACFU7T_38965 [Streptomyces sp. NPDC057555]|uniref:hypothetical protein n=1 Tax=Streptomyces sp. NPDC057555 TaxID=3346166 RepID=UPI00367569A7
MDEETNSVAGRFWTGEDSTGNVLSPSASWLVTTQDRGVAEAISNLYGGRPRPRPERDRIHELQLERRDIAVITDGPLVNRLLLTHGGEVIHTCDGFHFLEPMPKAGQPCGCPASDFARKAAARSGYGPVPDLRITFRLAAAPEAGRFLVTSSSWDLAASLRGTSGDPLGARRELSLDRKVITTRSGMTVSYVSPVLRSVERDDPFLYQHRVAA